MDKNDKKFFELLLDPSVRRFLVCVKQQKGLYIAVISLNIVLTMIALVHAEVIRRVFNSAPQIPRRSTLMFILVFAGLAVFSNAVSFLRSILDKRLNETIIYTLRRRVLDHFMNLPLAYYENQHTSAPTNMLFHELEVVKDFVVYDVQRLITLPISFLTVGGYLITIHPALGVIALSIGPLQLLSNLILQKQYKEIVQSENAVMRNLYFHVIEVLQGIREVKINQMELFSDERMKALEQQGVHYGVLLERIRAIRGVFRELPSQIGFLIGFAVAVNLMVSGQMKPGALIAFISLIDRVVAPFTTLVGIISNLQRSVSGSRQLLDVFEMPVEDKAGGMDLQSGSLAIQFKKVCFEYQPGLLTLQDISFSLPSGSSLALVGPSGSGKSTIIKLLYRFYDYQSGSIEINGIPITQYSIKSLRDNMALVSQDIFLFDASIAENIAMGMPDVTHEKIERAAILAHAYDFISALPKGFETPVGERGIRLSHGQKQRISIARAILRNASILILDEPTSALDVETEAMFQQSLQQLPSHCTKIIIAHRISTIRHAENILFLEAGKVFEYGSPAELLASDGRFRTYWDA